MSENNKEILTVDQFKDRISTIKKKSDEHLSKLEESIKNEDTDLKNLSEKQDEIIIEIQELVESVEQNTELIEELKKTDTNYAVYFNNLKETLHQHPIGWNTPSETSSRQEQLQSLWKDKRALTAGIAGAGYWFYKWYNSATADLQKSDSFRSKTRKRTKWLFSGVFHGALRWAWALLWYKAVEYGYKAIKWIINGIDYISDPKQWMQDAKNWMIKSIKNLWALLWLHAWEEIYDAWNRVVEENRLDEWYDEVTMYDANKIRLFNRSTNKEEFINIWENIEIPEALLPNFLDEKFKDNDFTDKFLLTVKTTNMRCSAARVKSYEKNNGEAVNKVWIIEQDLLKLQQAVQSNESKEDIQLKIKNLQELITSFEKNDHRVVGTDDRNKIINFINTHKSWWGDNLNARLAQRDRTETKIMDTMRSRWWPGNSDVVANNLINDLTNTEKYGWIMKIFDDNGIEELLELLSHTTTTTKIDESITQKISNCLKDAGFSDNVSLIANNITLKLIATYHETVERIETALPQIKIWFERSFGKGIEPNYNKDNAAQNRMIETYEKTALEWLQNKAKNSQYPEWFTMEQRREIVHNYARDMSKKQMMYGAIMNEYASTFFYEHLSNDKKKNEKEILLEDINGSGTLNPSDNTIKASVDIGMNIAISLIPMVGAELVIASAIARAGAMVRAATITWRVARLALRAAVWHSIMSLSSWILSWWSIAERLSTMFDNFTDRKAFTQNAMFFTVVWKLGPWLQQEAKILWKITPTTKIASKAFGILNSELLLRLWAISTEAAVVTWANCLDPDIEWSWGEFFTIAMMSVALQSKVGEKIKNYKFSKNSSGNIVATLNRAEAWAIIKAENNLTNIGKNVSSIVEKESKFKVWNNQYRFTWNNAWWKTLKTLESGKWRDVTEKELQTILEKNYTSSVEKGTSKRFTKFTNSKQTVAEMFGKSSDKGAKFMEWCKNHNISRSEKMLVWDLFKNIGQGNFTKILFPHGFTMPRFSLNPKSIVASTIRRNKHLSFSIGSLLYGSVIGENGDAGIDEGIENFILFSVLWSTPLWFLIAANIDRSDIII